MIRGVHVQRAVLEATPTGFLRGRIARWRAAAEERAFDADIDVLGGQEQILRARFAEHLEAAAARLPDRLNALYGRDVHDQDRAVDELGEGNDPLDRLRLRTARVADRVVARQRIALVHHATGKPGDYAVVLGVHHDERAVLSRGRHDVEDLLVREPRALVGHEDLERTHAGTDR